MSVSVVALADGSEATLVCHAFADAIHVVMTTLARPGSLASAQQVLIHSRDSHAAQLVARRLEAQLATLHADSRRVLVSLALKAPLLAGADLDDADTDALNAALAPIVAALLGHIVAHTAAPVVVE